LRRYNPSAVIAQNSRFGGSTIGDFSAELKEKSDLKPKTLEGYAAALRKIVADVIGQGYGRGGGAKRRAMWRQAVESIKLTEGWRWKRRGGLRALEDENARLKRVVADQAVQIQILKEVNAKKW
jgi:hypothetical protein